MDSPTRFRRWVEPVIIGLITMAVAGLLLLSWQFVSKGGLIKLLGGMPALQIQKGLNGNAEEIASLTDQLTMVRTAQQQLMSRQWDQLVGNGREERFADREYQNDLEYPIELAIVIRSDHVLRRDGGRSHCMAHLEVQKVTTAQIQVDADYTDLCTLYTSVPPGGTYKLVMGTAWPPPNDIMFWNELR